VIVSYFSIFYPSNAEAKDSFQYGMISVKENNISTVTAITVNANMANETNVINLKKGQEHVISLETAKGGFEWHANPDYDRTVIDVSERHDSPVTKMPGTGEKVTFTIKALEPGTTNFDLIQKRNWETDIHQIMHYNIRVI
jgi:predicted secreted protein